MNQSQLPVGGAFFTGVARTGKRADASDRHMTKARISFEIRAFDFSSGDRI